MIYYKYRAFTERTLEILLKRELFFSDSLKLNDPLDSRIDINYYYEKVKLKLAGLPQPENERKSFILFLLNSNEFKNDERKINLNDALQEWLTRLGILSLSKTPHDALLWSHYGGSHKGVCFGFDFINHTFEGQVCVADVDYLRVPNYEDVFIKLVEDMSEFVRPWEEGHHHSDEEADSFYTKQISKISAANLFVKSDKWKYEEEFRIVAASEGARTFQPECLKQVIFGMRTAENDIKRIGGILQSPEWSHVEIKRVKHVPGSFDFEIGTM